MKKLLMAISLALVVGMGAAPANAQSRFFSSPPRIQVMSQNLYIGADLSRLLAGESPAAVLATVQETNYPERALKIAEAIDDFNPDLIGLQEVSDITVFTTTGQTVLRLDYLDILLKALAARGESYAVASTVDESDVTMPIDGPPATATTFGRVLDRDVILYRTRTTTVSDPGSANYTTNFTASIGGFPIEFTRGYTGVDATVRGRTVRVVNTHLEVENAPCATAGGAICQDLQAAELQQALAAETLPTILLGDFNAAPGTTAYNTFDNGGWTDSWNVRAPYPVETGFTCCQSEKLTNGPSELDKRIDLVWLSDGDFRASVTTTVVGDWEARKTPSGRWYSDHGGPFARLVWNS